MSSMLNMLLQQQAEGSQKNPLLGAMQQPAPQPAETAKPAPAPAAAQARTPWQTKMHALADAAHAISEHPLFGEMQGGISDVLHERHRQMMLHVKTLAKHGDSVLSELARVGGHGEVEHDDGVWDNVKDGLHEDLRDLAKDQRETRRSDGESVDSRTRHHDIRHHARAFTDDARRVADDPVNAENLSRGAGDEDAMHPDLIEHVADHSEGMTDRLEELLDDMGKSAHGGLHEYHTGVGQRVAVHDDLRKLAAEMREED